MVEYGAMIFNIFHNLRVANRTCISPSPARAPCLELAQFGNENDVFPHKAAAADNNLLVGHANPEIVVLAIELRGWADIPKKTWMNSCAKRIGMRTCVRVC